MKYLDISGNGLTSLPDEIGSLLLLEELNVGGNKLSNLPASISKLQNLKQLNIIGNPISKEDLATIKSLVPASCNVIFY
ncbi:MAG: leucine-rich repeat domain-containing protein [Crocinitomicaceae bacterium]|nr:leucine-rich repeat domain-containing protein [Crocinitomicaceae bacterium]